MKLNNTNEELFDGIFRENLGNAASTPPPGVWEGISSSIGSSAGAGIAGAAVKTALWMKAAIAATVVTVASIAVYQFIPAKEEAKASIPAVQQEEINTENTTTPEIQGDMVQNTDPSEPGTETTIAKRPASDIPENKSKTEHPEWKSNPDKPAYLWVEPGIKDFNTAETQKETSGKTDPSADENGIEKQGEKTDPAVDATVAAEPKPIFENGSIIVPNTFSPNNDGINDTFQIRISGEESVEITIFNNYNGNILFTGKGRYTGWDGRLPNGDLAPEGQYFVRVVYAMKGKARETETIRIHLFR